MLEKFLKKSTWTDIIISIIFIVFGITLLSNPDLVVSMMSMILGGIFILIGILKITEFFSEGKQNNYKVAIAISAIILGIVIMFYTGLILSAFRVIIGIWIIYSGIMNLQTTIIWKEFTSRAWVISTILSILIIIAGLFVLINTGAILKTIGFILIVYGFVDIIENILFIKYIDKN